MSELLHTKLAPPRLRAPIVPRGALLARLDAALDRRLTLISAQAGFGKTTVVSAWLAGGEGAAARPHAWLALDGGDNDPARFWRYVIAACQTMHPGAGADALA